MAVHIPSIKKCKENRKLPLPILSPIPFKIADLMNGVQWYWGWAMAFLTWTRNLFLWGRGLHFLCSLL